MYLTHLLLGSLAFCLGVGTPVTSQAGSKTTKGELIPAPHVDLQRYMGPWRIIATTDNRAERNFVDAVETYSELPGGRIAVKFEWRSKSFEAPLKDHHFKGKVKDPGTNAKWRMRLLPPFSAKYIILKVDESYQWAVVGHPSRKYGWVLARNRTLPEATYARALEVLRSQGYTTTRFRKVPQVNMASGGPY